MRSRTYIEKIRYSEVALKSFQTTLANPNLPSEIDSTELESFDRKKFLLRYPTVYVIHDDKAGSSEAYVGESNDIIQRTLQHLKADSKKRNSSGETWKNLAESDDAWMYIIGNSFFNKSLTLDVENKLMLYLSSAETISKLHNGRTNEQRDYYTREHFDDVFRQIWRQLRKHDKKLFPTESVIRDSALFKASPFHRLTNEQIQAKDKLVTSINETLRTNQMGQLILMEGEAGSGKTVLLSSLFFELFQGTSQAESINESDDHEDYFDFQNLDAHILVNHHEQLKVYQQIADKLGVQTKDDPRVWLPSTFIRKVSEASPVDVVVVDEAHLLLTQGNQGYSGQNHLYDLLKRAKVVVAVFDEKQILQTSQWWETKELENLRHNAAQTVCLRNQMRMDASPATVNWIRDFIENSIVNPIPKDDRNYDIQIFDSPNALHEAIKKTAQDETRGLSRLLATYDWEYTSAKKNPSREDGYWGVKINNDFFMPWNYQIEVDRKTKRRNKHLAWAEQIQTINEVGSLFTIQGFDLNYCGVILGPSITYREGKVVIDPKYSWNKKATNKRTLADDSKVSFAEKLLRNELNVLMTRGVHGLYIYAVDEELQKRLKQARLG